MTYLKSKIDALTAEKNALNGQVTTLQNANTSLTNQLNTANSTIAQSTNKTAYYTSPTVEWGNINATADYTVTTSGGYIAYAIMSANLGGYNPGGNSENGYATIGFTVYNGPAGNTTTSTSLGSVQVGGSSMGSTIVQGIVTCFTSFSGTLWIRIFKHTQNNTNTSQTVSVY